MIWNYINGVANKGSPTFIMNMSVKTGLLGAERYNTHL